ncbi:putative RNA-directed DNA polymerase, eukaryota, reverse transcriptase zinc-binding domain protein [Tanacetum coccineum]
MSIMVTVNNVTYTIRVREFCSWTPTFVASSNDCDDSDDEEDNDTSRNESIEENDIKLAADNLEDAKIEEIVRDQELEDKVTDNNHCNSSKPEKPIDSDPFELDHLIKMSGKVHKPSYSKTPEYPPSFSSIPKGDHAISDSIYKLSNGDHIQHPGFSMLKRLEETIRISLALGLNMEGLRDLNKRRWIRDLCHVNKVNFLAIQESKMLQVDLWMLRQIWGNVHFDFASTSTRGMSGGIICLWNSLVFRKSRITCNDNYVVIDGLWIPNDIQDGISVVMGDFNKVRDEGERYGSVFYDRQAGIFNEFITDNSLIDIPLGVYNFTWTNKWGTKMSKPDRFLVSESFLEMFLHATGLVLEKGIPGHRPILLKESIVDYGPTPFWFFHSWLEMDGFQDLVVQTWRNNGLTNANGFMLFKKKLQNLKKCSEEEFINRRDSLAIMGNIDRLEAKDYAQKVKIKWDLEGDENTNFFHGTLKKKRRQLAIRGILKNGDWIDAPDKVKDEFLLHFSNRFKQPNVWDCGGDRAPGPDGFTFRFFTTFWDTIAEDVVPNAKFVSDFRHISLIGCQYKIIGKLLANRLSKVIRDCISPVQSAFIKGRGLQQGDSLSPFLFILAMEGLHSLTYKAEELGLKINVDKSNVLGVGVSDEEVSQMSHPDNGGNSRMQHNDQS